MCGAYADKTTKTFSNPCVACSDEKVASYGHSRSGWLRLLGAVRWSALLPRR